MPTSTPSQLRVLFVDDEPAILNGLGRMLRPLRDEIRAEFAGSGREALARLAQEPFDVVVADIRMPAMDGAALLAEVRRAYPHVVRVVLSGHADVGTALREVPVAQQFVCKPCDASSLRRVILRAVALRELLEDSALRALVASLGNVPARPKLEAELSDRLLDPTATSHDIAKLLGRDAQVSAQLLRIVNSAYFGLPKRVVSLESAISHFGTSMLRSLLLSIAAAQGLGARAQQAGLDLEARETHALLSANLAMQFFTDKHARECAFAAGLLQNIGELLLMATAPEIAQRAITHAHSKGLTLDEAEHELSAIPHAHVGAYLLGSWGLSYGVIESVAHHHHPEHVTHDALDLVDAVYVSTLIADHFLSKQAGSLERAQARLDALGAGDRLQRVQTIAEHWLQQPERAS